MRRPRRRLTLSKDATLSSFDLLWMKRSTRGVISDRRRLAKRAVDPPLCPPLCQLTLRLPHIQRRHQDKTRQAKTEQDKTRSPPTKPLV